MTDNVLAVDGRTPHIAGGRLGGPHRRRRRLRQPSAPPPGIFYGAVLRADMEDITIGAGTNIQDGAVVHADPDAPCRIGAGVTVGHAAIVHGCTVEDNCSDRHARHRPQPGRHRRRIALRSRRTRSCARAQRFRRDRSWQASPARCAARSRRRKSSTAARTPPPIPGSPGSTATPRRWSLPSDSSLARKREQLRETMTSTSTQASSRRQGGCRCRTRATCPRSSPTWWPSAQATCSA